MLSEMAGQIRELAGLRVTIDNVVQMENSQGPPDRPYTFVYFITIHNDSDDTVTIKGRKWVVTDDNDNRIVVEGDGVVGQFPRLEPGEKFSYNSSHAVACDSVAEGAYIGIKDDGEPVLTRIPAFQLRTDS